MYNIYNEHDRKEMKDMTIHIDFNSDEAIYIQLRNQIVLGIAKEEMKNGESLPSVRQLAEELGVNMHTVNKAYSLLRQEGFVTIDRRRGAMMDRRHGAVIHIETSTRPRDDLEMTMKLLVAEAKCRHMAVEELQQIIKDFYQEFDAE